MRHYIKRFLLLLTGLFFFSFGVTITINARIGFSPWEVFHAGLSMVTGFSVGTVSILLGIIIGIAVTILGEKLGLGSVLNILLIGLKIDIFLPIIPTAANTPIGIIMMVSGIFSISLGSCFYIKSAFGVGPRDNLMVVLTRKTKLPVGACRFGLELTVTVIGWLLGGMVWFGTVIFVALIGFSIQLTFKLFRLDATAIKHENLRETYLAIRSLARKQPQG